MAHTYAAKVLCFVVACVFATQVASAQSNSDSKTNSFDVLELRVIGNTVLDARSVERSLYPFLGVHKTIDDVEAARAALEKLYHDEGYPTVFVDIPEQAVDQGVVRLHVLEGRLRSVRTKGARYFSDRRIRAALPEAKPKVVPHFPTLQKQLSAVNTQTADRSVVPVLKAGPVPGTVDLTLTVDDHLPVHGSLELNNQYAVDTSELRALGALSYDNLFGRLDSFSLQYQTAPQQLNEVKLWVASYVHRIKDWRWALYYVDSKSSILLSQSDLGVRGTGNVYGSRLLVPLSAGASGNHSLNVGVDYKDFVQTIGSTGSSSDLRTPIQYFNFSFGYSGFCQGKRTQGSLNAGANFGIRGAGNYADKFENKRYVGSPNYFAVRADASVGTRLPADLTLTWKIAGQYTQDPLIDNEQFSITGADGVRGYLEAEEIADTGFKTSLQFGTPQWKIGSAFAGDAFVFYDYGRTGVNDALSNESAHLSIASLGIGVNLKLLDHLSGSATWAYPLRDANRTKQGDTFVLFDVRGYW